VQSRRIPAVKTKKPRVRAAPTRSEALRPEPREQRSRGLRRPESRSCSASHGPSRIKSVQEPARSSKLITRVRFPSSPPRRSAWLQGTPAANLLQALAECSSACHPRAMRPGLGVTYRCRRPLPGVAPRARQLQDQAGPGRAGQEKTDHYQWRSQVMEHRLPNWWTVAALETKRKPRASPGQPHALAHERQFIRLVTTAEVARLQADREDSDKQREDEACETESADEPPAPSQETSHPGLSHCRPLVDGGPLSPDAPDGRSLFYAGVGLAEDRR
jgi:hypothetical protein